MNNKGFALSGMLYTILAIFVLLVVGLLTMFNSRKTILDKLKKKVLDETSNVYEVYNLKAAGKYQIDITKSGYYEMEVVSPKITNFSGTLIYGSTFLGKIYLEKGTILHAEINKYIDLNKNPPTSYPSDMVYKSFTVTGIYYFDSVTKTNKNLVLVDSFSSSYIQEKYNQTNFENVQKFGNNNITNSGWVKITYVPEIRQNADLNKVKYIKDCITESTDTNYNALTSGKLEGCTYNPKDYLMVQLKTKQSLKVNIKTECIDLDTSYECSNPAIVKAESDNKTNLKCTYPRGDCSTCTNITDPATCSNNKRYYMTIPKSSAVYPEQVCQKKYFTEIKALVDSENKIEASKITGDINLNETSKLVDDNLNTKVQATTFDSTGKSCIVAELNNIYNLDSITVWHNIDDRKYSGRTLSVSTDGVNYRLIDNYEKKETAQGITVKANEVSQVKKIGSVYAPIKKHIDGTVWMRIYHYNNLFGTILWDAKEQLVLSGGIDKLYKKSILYYMKENNNNLKFNNKYEFMIEYPDEYPGKYFRWSQTSNFTTESTISGYSKIENTFDKMSNGQENQELTGLIRNSTILNVFASTSNDYYSLGALESWSTGITGPYKGTINSIKKTTDLWVRIE